MFYFLGIGINLFLILLLFSKKNKILADKFLLVWLIIICCHLSLYIVVTSTTVNVYANLFIVAPVFPLLHGPMLYFYTAAITTMLPANKKIWILHFITPFLVFLLSIPFALLPLTEKINVVNSGGKGYELQQLIITCITILSGVFYVVWLLILLSKHKKNIANRFSYYEKITLNWLRYLIYGLGLIWVIVIIQAQSTKSYDNYIFGFVAIIVIIMGYFGIKQGRIYNNISNSQYIYIDNISTNNQFPITGDPDKEVLDTKKVPNKDLEKEEEILAKRKYLKSGLTETSLQILYEKLKELVEQEKIYTEPELSLARLAEKLNTHPNYLSQVINEKEGKSFYDYINSLRVEEFKRLVQIPNNKQFTIMSLAFECGFNSKSSFNKNFKKFTDQSPSEYLNNVN